MNVTKRQLGVNYLAGTGLILSAVLLIQGAMLLRAGGHGFGLLTGLVPSVSLISVRLWLDDSRLDDDQIWRIATWGGLGIACLTLANTGILLVHEFVTPVLNTMATMLIANVGAGGVAGILIGWSREHARTTRQLSEKNAVLTRVLRHDIRNAAGIILGSADIIRADDPDIAEELTPIQRKAEELIELGDAARYIDETIDPADRLGPVDAVPLIERRVDRIAAENPGATIETRLTRSAWVHADELLGVVVRELLENAVEHAGSGTPHVQVSIGDNPIRDQVTITVSDDGPGVPERELLLLSSGEEAQLEHSLGTGLWLVKWLVQRFNGSLSIESGEGDGTDVEVRLPRGRRPGDSANRPTDTAVYAVGERSVDSGGGMSTP